MINLELDIPRGTLVQFHVDRSDPDTFIVGELAFCFENAFVAYLLSPSGRWDGIAMIPLDDLVHIQIGTNYIMDLNILNTLHLSSKPEPVIQRNSALQTITDYAQNHQHLIAIECLKSGQRDIIGFVKTTDKSHTVVQQINERGFFDGLTVVSNDDISRVFCADDDLLCRELLFAYREQNDN